MNNLDKLWTAIRSNIDKIKALPNDIIIGLIDENNEYGRIEPTCIKYDDTHVWVQLNRRSKVTLFEKSDYEPINEKDNLDILLFAQNHIISVFSFTKKVDPKSMFNDWQ